MREITVSGAPQTYLDIEYDPIELHNYGLESSIITSGLQNFLGQQSIVGDIDRIDRNGNKERITLLLETEALGSDIGKTPLTTINGKIIYLDNIAKLDYKNSLGRQFLPAQRLNTIN